MTHPCKDDIGAILPPWPSEAMADWRILLASNSPRRRELLSMILRRFDIAESRNISETYPADLAADKVPAYLSQLKARAYADVLEPNEVIITADTVVVDGGDILGKPADADGARRMLRRLAGHAHTVVTGVTLTSTERTDTFAETTRVHFGPLTDSEIEQYVDLYYPLDKAGAYGIQEWIGAVGITGIEGCFYNVMGLPLNALYRHLRTFFERLDAD